MNTQILKHITNYTISASNEEGIKLEGDFSINTENKIENYNSTIYNTEGILLGNANYNEYEDNKVNYNYNTQPDYKLTVITLVDKSITDIKAEVSKNELD
ncbi:hypothetical protein [Bacteroides stercoris]|jgi:hypothetical protein|uniref:hypothetical protein n=1 Tax=Bacteroides stercoris TaxID=46506 RepID=UPI0015AFA3ED|nr:MAG TPA: hypothetical protein [Caudoviricetes sp.]